MTRIGRSRSANGSRCFFAVLAESGWLLLVGIVIGVPAAIAATRLISSRLVGIGSNDPVTILLAAFFLTAVAIFASWLPGRKAAKVNPMVALRCE